MPYPVNKARKKVLDNRQGTAVNRVGMARKTIIVVWLVALTLAPFCLAEAQQAKKVTMIGFLGSRPLSDTTGVRNVFEYVRRILLDDLGYVEGKNIAFE